MAELDWLSLPANLDRIFIPVGYIEGPPMEPCRRSILWAFRFT